MTPADREELRRLLREESERARAEILAESKRQITDHDHDAEAALGSRIAHERSVADAKLHALRVALGKDMHAQLKLRRSESPGLDLALRMVATFAAVLVFLWLARKGLLP